MKNYFSRLLLAGAFGTLLGYACTSEPQDSALGGGAYGVWAFRSTQSEERREVYVIGEVNSGSGSASAPLHSRRFFFGPASGVAFQEDLTYQTSGVQPEGISPKHWIRGIALDGDSILVSGNQLVTSDANPYKAEFGVPGLFVNGVFEALAYPDSGGDVPRPGLIWSGDRTFVSAEPAEGLWETQPAGYWVDGKWTARSIHPFGVAMLGTEFCWIEWGADYSASLFCHGSVEPVLRIERPGFLDEWDPEDEAKLQAVALTGTPAQPLVAATFLVGSEDEARNWRTGFWDGSWQWVGGDDPSGMVRVLGILVDEGEPRMLGSCAWETCSIEDSECSSGLDSACLLSMGEERKRTLFLDSSSGGLALHDPTGYQLIDGVLYVAGTSRRHVFTGQGFHGICLEAGYWADGTIFTLQNDEEECNSRLLGIAVR